jgi:NarL family two-component system response regulator LiaR
LEKVKNSKMLYFSQFFKNISNGKKLKFDLFGGCTKIPILHYIGVLYMSISAILIEDNVKYSEILKEFLGQHDIEIKKVFHQQEGAVDYILSNTVDFLIVDMHLTEECNAEGLEIIKSVSSNIDSNIIVLTGCYNKELITGAVNCRIDSYEYKEDFMKLPTIMERILEEVHPTKHFNNLYLKEKEKNFYSQFTNAEKEIISYLQKGCTAKDISKKEYRSIDTVKNHIKNIRKKADGDLEKLKYINKG